MYDKKTERRAVWKYELFRGIQGIPEILCKDIPGQAPSENHQ